MTAARADLFRFLAPAPLQAAFINVVATLGSVTTSTGGAVISVRTTVLLGSVSVSGTSATVAAHATTAQIAGSALALAFRVGVLATGVVIRSGGPGGYPQVVLNDGPVAYWRLNDLAGTEAVDQTAHALDGTYTSGGVTLGAIGPLRADPSEGVTFDGTVGQMVSPLSPLLTVVGGSFSIEAWIALSTVPSFGNTFEPVLNAAGRWFISVNATSQLSFSVNDGTHTPIATGLHPIVADGTYHHVVGTRNTNNSTILLFLDGALVASTPDTTSFSLTALPATGSQVEVGGAASVWFPGTVSEVALYSSALAPIQVSAHYAAATAPPASTALMESWIPDMWYSQSNTVKALLQAEAQVENQLESDINAVLRARLPETADIWGLQRLEDETAIGERPDLSVNDRRTRLIAHFRGIGTTIARLTTIARSWGFGDVQIIPDPEAYILYVVFTNTTGVPNDITSQQAELRADVEAHLGITYQFRFLTWGQLRQSNATWQSLIDFGRTWGNLPLWQTPGPSNLIAVRETTGA